MAGLFPRPTRLPTDGDQIAVRDANFYDQAYYDGPGKSNYEQYTICSSPFADHADTLIKFLEYYRLDGPVLDIGCAKGYLVYVLRQRGIEAYGVDWSDYALASASPDIRPFLQRASAWKLPFGGRRFSLAVSFDVLEHIDEWRARQALVEAARVSVRQLHQVNTGRHAAWAFDTDESHCLKLPLRRWRSMAAELGLTRTVLCEPDRRLPFLDAVSRQ